MFKTINKEIFRYPRGFLEEVNFQWKNVSNWDRIGKKSKKFLTLVYKFCRILDTLASLES